jgi:hypothetical protein
MVPLHLLGVPFSAAIIVSRTPEARDCPDAGRLAAEVERIVGRPLVEAGAQDVLVVRAEFSRHGGIYQAKVQLTGAREGERVLSDEGVTCEALADAVAVTTALLLDPSERPPKAPAARPAPEPTPSWLELWVSGRYGVADGLVGGPTWIAGGGLGASLGPLTSIELGATVTGSYTSQLGGGNVHVRLWYVELGGFRSLTGDTLQFGPCLQLMGGVLGGVGEGYATTSSASLAWFAAGAGLRAEVRFGSNLRLGARALALVPTRKESFSVGYVGTAHESSAVGGSAEFMLGMKFW